MFKAYGNFWKKYVDFTGKSTRSEYWFVYLWNLIIGFVFGLLFVISGSGILIYEDGSIDTSSVGTGFWIVLALFFIYILAIIIPGYAIAVRRLRDGGFHWAFIFLSFATIAGAIALIVLLAMPSKSIKTTRTQSVAAKSAKPTKTAKAKK